MRQLKFSYKIYFIRGVGRTSFYFKNMKLANVIVENIWSMGNMIMIVEEFLLGWYI